MIKLLKETKTLSVFKNLYYYVYIYQRSLVKWLIIKNKWICLSIKVSLMNNGVIQPNFPIFKKLFNCKKANIINRKYLVVNLILNSTKNISRFTIVCDVFIRK